jgi:ribosomal protein S18 acetylase RimI-like enzyme
MHTDFTLRRATEDDADAVAALSRELGYPSDSGAMRSRIAALLQSSADVLFVADDASGASVGWLHAHTAQLIESGFRAEILGLVVSPTARRAGIGRALMAEAERWAESRGAEVVVVRSNVSREESHAFYPALGYENTKTQRVYRKRLNHL